MQTSDSAVSPLPSHPAASRTSNHRSHGSTVRRPASGTTTHPAETATTDPPDPGSVTVAAGEATEGEGTRICRSPREAHLTGSPIPVGGRLAQFAQNWEELYPGRWVLGVVRHGYRIEFTADPPSRFRPRGTSVPHDVSKRSVLEEEIAALLRKKAIRRRLDSEPPPRFQSRFFLAPKKGGTWRPILNLRPFNRGFVKPRKFRMETLADITPVLSQGMWATSLDLKDAYLHIPIATEDQTYLTFAYGGNTFQFTSLPFGLSTSPRVFTRITRPILAYLRRRGMRIFAYLDDWLIVADSEVQAERDTARTLALLHRLGWIVNEDKSSLTPAQVIQYLGARVDLGRGRLAPTKERVDDLGSDVQRILTRENAPARLWLRMLGKMASLVNLLRRCRLHMRPLQQHLRRFYHQTSSGMAVPVPLPRELRPYLRWWRHKPNVIWGVPLQEKKPKSTITTDASMTGWGATFNDLEAAGRWSPEEKALHINALEAKAILNAVTAWQQELRGHAVYVRTDNSTTVAYVNREGGTRSQTLTKIIWDLLHLCDNLNISLTASHLAGVDNQPADILSRTTSSNEWELTKHWADWVFEIFSRPNVDLFASASNFKIPTFCTRTFHPRAWKVDAFSFPWANLYLYAFPPFALIRKVLVTLRDSDATMLLVAPCWPNQTWFPLVMELLIDCPLRLPPRALAPRDQTNTDRGIPSLQLSVWKLSAGIYARREFLRRLRNMQRKPGANPQSELTIPDSPGSTDGQQTTLVIPWRPLSAK